MNEKDIVHELGDYWVARMPSQYTVYRHGLVVSKADSSYPKTDDGLSLAIARVNYLGRTK